MVNLANAAPFLPLTRSASPYEAKTEHWSKNESTHIYSFYSTLCPTLSQSAVAANGNSRREEEKAIAAEQRRK